MSLRVVARVSLVLMILCAQIISTIAYFETTASATSNIWAGGASTQDLGLLQTLTNTGNVDCSYMDLKSRYVFKEKVVSGKIVYDSQTYEQEGRTFPGVCVAQNEHGLISTSGQWSKQGDKDSVLPIDSSRYFIIPASGGTATIFADIAPLYGYQYSVNHNLEYLGSLSTKTYGTGQSARKEKIWKIKIQGE